MRSTWRSALARLIRSLGMQVKAFASAREFLGCQRPEGPACLILDVRLAGENGLLVQEACGSPCGTRLSFFSPAMGPFPCVCGL